MRLLTVALLLVCVHCITASTNQTAQEKLPLCYKSCHVLGEVDEYPEGHPPTAKEFWTKYVHGWKPVIVRGANKNMKAHHLWSPKYLSQKYGDIKVRGEMKYEDRKKRIPAAISMDDFISNKRMDFYAVSALPHSMAADVTIPKWMLCGDRSNTNKGYRIPERHGRNWLTLIVEPGLWLSDGRTSSSLHYDQYNILNCLLSGSKDWKFINTRDPDNLKYMHGTWSNNIHRRSFKDPPPQSDYSAVNVNQVDLEKFPHYDKLKFHKVTQRAGDCLYIPYAYLHQVNKTTEGWSTAVSYMFARDEKFSEAACKDAPQKDVPYNAFDTIWHFSGRGVVPIGYGNPLSIQEMLYRMLEQQKERVDARLRKTRSKKKKKKLQRERNQVPFEDFFEESEKEFNEMRDSGPLDVKRMRWLFDNLIDTSGKGYMTKEDVDKMTLGDFQILLAEYDYDELSPNQTYEPKPVSLVAEQEYELQKFIDEWNASKRQSSRDL